MAWQNEKLSENSPKRNTPMASKPEYQIVDDLRVPTFFDPNIVCSAMEYSPNEDDIIVSSYPKCGASLVSQIVHLILRNGQQFHSADEYFSCIPLLEMTGIESLSYAPSPHCIKTYIPPHRLKYTQRAKYIYVARRFSDCVVSYYKHTKMLPAYFFTNGAFEDFLDLFVKGDAGYGDFFKHFYSGWRNWRWCNNALFITYELLTANLRDGILQIASFLGEEYSKNLLNSGEKVLKDILFFSGSYMKSTFEDFWQEMFLDKLLTGKCQMHFPIAERYATVMKEAETKGHYFMENPDEIILTEENNKILDKYLKDNVWEDWYSESLYFMKKQLNC